MASEAMRIDDAKVAKHKLRARSEPSETAPNAHGKEAIRFVVHLIFF
jgi:hypothetical protein